jgi:hypothetical protein
MKNQKQNKTNNKTKPYRSLCTITTIKNIDQKPKQNNTNNNTTPYRSLCARTIGNQLNEFVRMGSELKGFTTDWLESKIGRVVQEI